MFVRLFMFGELDSVWVPLGSAALDELPGEAEAAANTASEGRRLDLFETLEELI
jgi:hypothetical protein